VGSDPYRTPVRTVAEVLGLFANLTVEMMTREIARRLEEEPSPEMVKAAAETLRQAADLLEKQRALIDQQKKWIQDLRNRRKRR